MSFLELTSQLTGVLPGLSPFLADQYINNAWIDLCNARNWAWLTIDGAVFCPAQITTGTVSITQLSTTVTCSATASTALLAQNLAATPTLTNLQIRFGATPQSIGQVYSIVALDQTNPAAIVLTLDRAVVETTNATSNYQCYRCYITPPVVPGTRFLAWESFTDMVNGWPLKLNSSSAYFDVLDPQRQSQGQAYNVGRYESNRTANVLTGATAPNPNQSAGVPNYELWPHPTSGQTFYVRMKVKGARFLQPFDEIPTNIIEPQTIMHVALGKYAYPFALANRAHFPAWKLIGDIPTLIKAELSAVYGEPGGELRMAKRQDDEQQLTSVHNRGHGLRTGGARGVFRGANVYPIDSNFMQSHLIRF
jgi:hypothetical protein